MGILLFPNLAEFCDTALLTEFQRKEKAETITLFFHVITSFNIRLNE